MQAGTGEPIIAALVLNPMIDTPDTTALPRRGQVWHGERLVGRLREDGERHICFTYDQGWIDNGGFALSHSRPLSYGQDEVKAHHWFTGLLPEGDSQEQVRIINGFHVSRYNPLKLLLSIGGDCAGAFSVLPEGVSPAQARIDKRTLADTAFQAMVHAGGKDLPTLPDGRVRFALAGAQRKLAVVYDGVDYSLSGYGRPSSHILKFETHKRVCFAEHIATRIAGAAGLPVVKTEYLETGHQGKVAPCLRIDRFDRDRDAQGTILLRHQEDMLQALGLSPIYKYQSQGGPSLRDVAKLLQEEALNPETDIATLADWQMLNFLLGNWDGHAKNLALLYEPGAEAPALAPFYDIVSIEYLNTLGAHWDRDMAFAVGERNGPDRIRRRDWESMAEDLGLQPGQLLDRLEELATRLPGIAEQAVEDFVSVHGDQHVYRQMPRMVRKRCARVLRSGLVLVGRRRP